MFSSENRASAEVRQAVHSIAIFLQVFLCRFSSLKLRTLKTRQVRRTDMRHRRGSMSASTLAMEPSQEPPGVPSCRPITVGKFLFHCRSRSGAQSPLRLGKVDSRTIQHEAVSSETRHSSDFPGTGHARSIIVAPSCSIRARSPQCPL